MDQKTLLEYLTSQLEHERVLAVAELIYQTETYLRVLAHAITGLGMKGDEQFLRDCMAVRRNAEEVSAWLTSHYQALYQHVHPQTPVVAPESNEEAQSATLH